jgi:hypothetical protein
VTKLTRHQGRVSTLIVAVILIAGLNGCSLIYGQKVSWPSRAELVGSWVHAGPGDVRTELDLGHDGSLEVTNVPREVFTLYGNRYYNNGGHLQWSHLISLSGTWTLSKTTVGDLPAIDISAGPKGKVGGILTTMQVRGEGQGRTLSVVLGDPDNDNWFTFVRK